MNKVGDRGGRRGEGAHVGAACTAQRPQHLGVLLEGGLDGGAVGLHYLLARSQRAGGTRRFLNKQSK